MNNNNPFILTKPIIDHKECGPVIGVVFGDKKVGFSIAESENNVVLNFHHRLKLNEEENKVIEMKEEPNLMFIFKNTQSIDTLISWLNFAKDTYTEKLNH